MQIFGNFFHFCSFRVAKCNNMQEKFAYVAKNM